MSKANEAGKAIGSCPCCSAPCEVLEEWPDGEYRVWVECRRDMITRVTKGCGYRGWIGWSNLPGTEDVARQQAIEAHNRLCAAVNSNHDILARDAEQMKARIRDLEAQVDRHSPVYVGNDFTRLSETVARITERLAAFAPHIFGDLRDTRKPRR